MGKEISERGTAMNQRMKMVREALGMSQANFAESADIGLGVIKNIDSNRTEPNDHFYNILCARYNINREWLETGDGSMFREKSRDEEIAEWAASLGDVGNEFKRRFVYALTKLNEDGWEVIERFAQTLYDEQMAENEQTKKDEGK